MGVCILGMGECGNKSSSSFESNTKIINQTMTNMVNSTSKSTTVHSFNSQDIQIEVGGDMIDCPLTMNQKMVVNQKVSVSLDVSSTKNLQNQISTALKTTNDNAIKQKSAFLQTASNESSTATTINEAISNLVSTNISDSVTESLSVLLKALQKGGFKIGGNLKCMGKPMVLTQDMLVTQIVDTITKALTGTTVSNITDTKSDKDNKSVVDQEGEGITGLIAAFGKLFTGPMMIIAVVIVIVAIVGAIVFFVFIKGGGKVPSPVAAFGAMLFGRKKVRFGRRY